MLPLLGREKEVFGAFCLIICLPTNKTLKITYIKVKYLQCSQIRDTSCTPQEGKCVVTVATAPGCKQADVVHVVLSIKKTPLGSCPCLPPIMTSFSKHPPSHSSCLCFWGEDTVREVNRPNEEGQGSWKAKIPTH